MKKNNLITLCFCFVALCIFILILLISNKTFFHNVYRVNNKEIFVPRFSYLSKKTKSNSIELVSLKSRKKLEKEILNYMDDFEYFENENSIGYKKGKLIIYEYSVFDKSLFRKIILSY